MTCLHTMQSLAKDQQCKPGYQAEYEEEHLEYTHKAVENQFKVLPADVEPPGMDAIDEVGHGQPDEGPQYQQANIQNGAPHEKRGQGCQIHMCLQDKGGRPLLLQG